MSLKTLDFLPDGRMTPKLAAEYVGLSVKTLAKRRSEGTGPPFVKAGRIFYYRADLDAWLLSRKVTSTAEARQRAASSSTAVPVESDHRGGDGQSE